MRKFIAPILILSFFILLFSRSLFSNSIPVTHDLELHAPRVVNYYLSLKQGQIPPRWAPNLNYGFGYPSFIFNYPYPYLASSFLYALGFSVEASLNLFLIISIFLSGLGVYTLSFLKTKKTYLSLLPAFLYICAPYFLLNIFVRGALGEIAFMSLLPWIFVLGELVTNPPGYWATRKLGRLAVSFFGVLVLVAFMLSHQVLVAFGLVLWFAWLLVKNGKTKIKQTGRIGIYLFLALLISSFSLLPMLLEKQFVKAGASSEYLLKHDLSGHVGIKDLIFSKWEYSGLVNSAENGRFAKTVGVLQLTIVVIAIWKLLKKKASNELVFWLFVFSFLIFLILPISMPVWKIFKFLEYLQFPWRLLGFVIFSVVMILIELIRLKLLSHLGVRILGILIIFSMFWALFFQARPVAKTAKSDLDWHHYPLTADSYGEIMPIWFDTGRNLALDKQLYLRFNDGQLDELSSGKNGLSELRWLGSEMSYAVEASQSAQIIQKTAYFPGWEARVNGNLVKINYQDSEYPGRIIIPLAKGQNKVEVKFTNNTWPRRVGDEMTMLGLVLWFIWVGYSLAKFRK